MIRCNYQRGCVCEGIGTWKGVVEISDLDRSLTGAA
jgi:hypothetical protein